MFSSEQDRRKISVEKSDIREAWQEHNGPSKPRSLWNEQPHIDSAVLNRFTPMNDSSGKQDNLSSNHHFKCHQS